VPYWVARAWYAHEPAAALQYAFVNMGYGSDTACVVVVVAAGMVVIAASFAGSFVGSRHSVGGSSRGFVCIRCWLLCVEFVG
jgi:hypothetical protein